MDGVALAEALGKATELEAKLSTLDGEKSAVKAAEAEAAKIKESFYKQARIKDQARSSGVATGHLAKIAALEAELIGANTQLDALKASASPDGVALSNNLVVNSDHCIPGACRADAGVHHRNCSQYVSGSKVDGLNPGQNFALKLLKASVSRMRSGITLQLINKWKHRLQLSRLLICEAIIKVR